MDFDPLDLSMSDPRHPFHVEHMSMALEEARTAAAEDEVPIGAVIVSMTSARTVIRGLENRT